MSVKWIIFDFDGTIADSVFVIKKITKDLAKASLDIELSDAEFNEMRDKSVAAILRKYNVPLLKIPGLLIQARKDFKNLMHEIVPVNGIPQAVASLKKLGYKMGIVSSNWSENILELLKENQLENYFDFIETVHNTLNKSQKMREVLEKNNTNINEAIYVGDEIRDVTSMNKIKMKTISVTWGLNSEKALRKINPNYIATDPNQLVEIVEKL